MANGNGLTQTAWAEHLRQCAVLSKEIGDILGLRDDPARQACFATVAIDAKGHGVFLSPTPEHTKTPVESRPAETKPDAPPVRATPPKGEVVGQNLGALRDPTPEQSETANRGALLDGINKAREVLLKTDPKFTPAGLNAYIQDKLKTDKTLGTLDMDQLGVLIEKLAKRIEAEKKKAPTSVLKEKHLAEAKEREAANATDDLEDWP